MDRAVSFYTNKLDFLLKLRFGDHWAEIEGYGVRIGLHPAGPDIKTGNSISLGFSVANMEMAVKEFETKGLTFDIHVDDQVLLAHFKDPDGHPLYLVQAKY